MGVFQQDDDREGRQLFGGRLSGEDLGKGGEVERGHEWMVERGR